MLWEVVVFGPLCVPSDYICAMVLAVQVGPRACVPRGGQSTWQQGADGPGAGSLTRSRQGQGGGGRGTGSSNSGRSRGRRQHGG